MSTRLLSACAAAFALAACSTLQSDPLPELGPPEYATVAAKRMTSISIRETRVERAIWAALSLDPAAILLSTFAVEDEFGHARIAEYDLALLAGPTETVRSRYAVEPGACVTLRRIAGERNVVLITAHPSQCAPPTQTEEAPPAEVEQPDRAR